MSVFIARKLQPNWTVNFIRHGHTGPSRLRLKRKDKNKEDSRSSSYEHDDPYIFHPRVRTVEPVRQALRNTKSIVNEGLPSIVLSSVNNIPFENILPQIKHSLVTCEDEHNVKYVQRSKGVIMNVVKGVWSCAARYPGLLWQTISYRPNLTVSWQRFGYNLQVSGRTGLLFSSEFALPNFASSAEVENTKEMSVEEKDELISPVFELSQNMSRSYIDNGFYYDVFPFPQTLVITERNWKLPHLIAQGIMFSFGRLVERAVYQNGASFGETLQHPLSIRAIVYNEKKMALLCYQLNTLDFDKDEGVKNQLWLSSEFPISLLKQDSGHRHSKNKENKTDSLEFPEKEFKEIVALLLYGQSEETTQQKLVNM